MAKSIVLFHEDLRLDDHQPLTEAVSLGAILPVYILDIKDPNQLGGQPKFLPCPNDLNQQLDQKLSCWVGITDHHTKIDAKPWHRSSLLP